MTIETRPTMEPSPKVWPVSVPAYHALGELGLIPEKTELLYISVLCWLFLGPLMRKTRARSDNYIAAQQQHNERVEHLLERIAKALSTSTSGDSVPSGERGKSFPDLPSRAFLRLPKLDAIAFWIAYPGEAPIIVILDLL